MRLRSQPSEAPDISRPDQSHHSWVAVDEAATMPAHEAVEAVVEAEAEMIAASAGLVTMYPHPNPKVIH